MNVKVQNGILNRLQNDTLVMPNLFRHLIWAFDLTFELWHLEFDS